MSWAVVLIGDEMQAHTTDDGWSRKYLKVRTKKANQLTQDITDIHEKINEGDYSSVDKDVMLELANVAVRLALSIESKFG